VIAYDEDNNVIGFMVLFLVPIPGIKTINIQRIWYKPNQRQVLDEFIKIGRKWAKENDIKKVIITVTRPRIKALQRKWGFKVTSVNMERGIY
jgi:hypothetical protein